MELEAKVRYSAKPSKATIIPLENNKVKVVFENKTKSHNQRTISSIL